MMDLKALREVDYSDIPMGYKVIIIGLIDYATNLETSFDELSALVGWSKERCDQVGDSPMDCANMMVRRIAELEEQSSIWQEQAHLMAVELRRRDVEDD